MWTLLGCLGLAVLSGPRNVPAGAGAGPQGPSSATPPVRIVSPASGVLVEPGATLPVVVEVTEAGHEFVTAVVFIAPDGGDVVTTIEKRKKQRLEVSLRVPQTQLGPHNLEAYLVTDESGLAKADKKPPIVYASPVTINVETSRAVTALEVGSKGISFRFAGGQRTIWVNGTFEGGDKLSITDSSKTVFASANPNVAAVSGNGTVTATGGGSTIITVRYETQAVQIPVTVPVTIRGDLDGNKDVTQDDVNILLASIQAGVVPTGPFDARDLNSDGVIDQADLDILRSLCTRPNCAVK